MSTMTLTDFKTSQEYPTKEKSLWWQDRGLMYTATGYGNKIPTHIMLLDGKIWKRVYARIFSNSGTTYFLRKGARVVVY